MTETPTRQIFDMMIAFGASQSIYAATALELPEHIAAGHTTVCELAEATGADEKSLGQLIRLLVNYGILRRDNDSGFVLTPAGELLRAGTPGSMRDLVTIFGREFYQAWGNLTENIRTGRPAFEVAFGEPMYSYFTAHPDSGRSFDRAMNNGYFFADVPQVVDFSGMHTVVDIAGGTGGLLCEILRSNPDLTGVLYDQERVIGASADLVADQNLTDRVSFTIGDFGQWVPQGGDCYVLSRILHSQDDESAVQLLKRCLDALGPDGTLVVVERPIAPEGATSLGVWSDVHMMVLVGGVERAEDEYINLLHKSGFVLREVHPIALDFVVMVAKPAH
jgi:O-methyltransferase